ncbi:hypothetical protein BG004_003502 [Podila humilis]|nr:hypothetical protein BG004_003502 [Podila humilis]
MRPTPQVLPLDNVVTTTNVSPPSPRPCVSSSDLTAEEEEEEGPWGLPSPVWKKARVQSRPAAPDTTPVSMSPTLGHSSLTLPDTEPLDSSVHQQLQQSNVEPQENNSNDELFLQQQQQQQEQRHQHHSGASLPNDSSESTSISNIHIEISDGNIENEMDSNGTQHGKQTTKTNSTTTTTTTTTTAAFQSSRTMQELDLGQGLELGIGPVVPTRVGDCETAADTVFQSSSTAAASSLSSAANRSSGLLAPTPTTPAIITHGLTRTLSHANPHPHHTTHHYNNHVHTHTRNFSSPSLLDSFTSPEPMLSPIQSYFGSDPNAQASAFSLFRHDHHHYPRMSADDASGHSGLSSSDGYHGYATCPWSEQSTTPSRALSYRWTRRLSHPDSIPSAPSRLRQTSAAPTVPIASAALGRTWQEVLQSTSHPLDLSAPFDSQSLSTFDDTDRDTLHNEDQDLDEEEEEEEEEDDTTMDEGYDDNDDFLQSEDEDEDGNENEDEEDDEQLEGEHDHEHDEQEHEYDEHEEHEEHDHDHDLEDDTYGYSSTELDDDDPYESYGAEEEEEEEGEEGGDDDVDDLEDDDEDEDVHNRSEVDDPDEGEGSIVTEQRQQQQDSILSSSSVDPRRIDQQQLQHQHQQQQQQATIDMDEENVRSTLAHVLGLGRLGDDGLAGSLYNPTSSPNPRTVRTQVCVGVSVGTGTGTGTTGVVDRGGSMTNITANTDELLLARGLQESEFSSTVLIGTTTTVN